MNAVYTLPFRAGSGAVGDQLTQSVVARRGGSKQLPASATAVGKALLAQLSDGQVREVYARPSSELRALTPASLTTMDTLLAELRARARRDRRSPLRSARSAATRRSPRRPAGARSSPAR